MPWGAPPAAPPTGPRLGFRGEVRAGASTLIGCVLAVVVAVSGAGAYEEGAAADGGTLSGVVRFSGTPPTLEPLRVNKNRDICARLYRLVRERQTLQECN